MLVVSVGAGPAIIRPAPAKATARRDRRARPVDNPRPAMPANPSPSPSPSPLPLHIVEPTLSGEAGHCLSLVRALAQAAPEFAVTVWAGRGAAAVWPGPQRLVPHFDRRWRRLQALALYRRLLREPGRILVATAGSADMVLADWAARGRISPGKLFMLVHWLNAKRGKQRLLSGVARRQPGIEILAPTPATADFFADCGFRATVVNYPLAAPDNAAVEDRPAAGFSHLLVAGGARIDKGFDRVVDLVAEMQQRKLSLPIIIQVSLEPGQRDDRDLAHQLERLRGLRYGGLSLRDRPMDAAAYRAMFDGAIVIQPYRADDFRDRVSGVTLDALSAGSPVIATAGTWMAALLQRFDAGLAIADLSAASLLQAIDRLLADYPHYAARACVASAAVQSEHSARHLIDTVLQRS